MGKDLITRTATTLYEERKMTGKTIASLLFGNVDNDLSAGFRLDRYISSPYGIAYRNLANQSVVRQFTAGTTELIEVPVASEKTPIDEELQDQIAVGMEPTASQAMSIAKNVDQIIGDHLEGHNMTKNHQAIETVRTGIFPAKGVGGADLGLGYDHGRDAGNAIVYDFTAGGATMNQALLNISKKFDETNTPKGNRCVLMGSSWASQFGDDSDIREIMKANAVNQVLEQDIFERQFGQVEGLYVIARFKPVGATAPLWLLDYTPGTDYVESKGGAGAAWVPATEAIGFSLNDRTWTINRGVNVLDENGRSQRRVGDLVVDSYTEHDPVTTFVRSNTRHIYIYGNINHTLKSTGTFS